MLWMPAHERLRWLFGFAHLYHCTAGHYRCKTCSICDLFVTLCNLLQSWFHLLIASAAVIIPILNPNPSQNLHPISISFGSGHHKLFKHRIQQASQQATKWAKWRMLHQWLHLGWSRRSRIKIAALAWHIPPTIRNQRKEGLVARIPGAPLAMCSSFACWEGGSSMFQLLHVRHMFSSTLSCLYVVSTLSTCSEFNYSGKKIAACWNWGRTTIRPQCKQLSPRWPRHPLQWAKQSLQPLPSQATFQVPSSSHPLAPPASRSLALRGQQHLLPSRRSEDEDGNRILHVFTCFYMVKSC